MLHRLINVSKSNSFLLFGSRGTGKSTLVKSLFNKTETIYIDLLKFSEFEELASDPDSLEKRILQGTKWIIIDEIQKVPKLLDTVHRLIETRNVKFALTGSSSRKLKAGGANLLAGRAFIYDLFPLTHLELADKFDLLEAIKWGGLPKLQQFHSNEDKKLYLEAYAQSYLKEEIWEEHLVKNLMPFRKFLQIAAQCNGTVINYSKIAADVRVDTKTVQNYFQILEDTLLSFMLEPYHASLRKRQRTNPKFYFFDLGIVRALTQDFSLEISPLSLGYGYRFEHFLICEIFRLNRYFKKGYNLSFVRDESKKVSNYEIDLVIERPGMPLALIEIKSTNSLREEHLSGLKYFSSKFPGSECFCLSLDSTPKRFDNINALYWTEGIKAIGLNAPRN